ncbi:hypothetical protein AB0D38_18615, partial [Streptomyces sp. NPDC048279]|uniref:hypothetical protein n=1 Tax=Streptomyces sp. NPDC048279 TaxID=3154714 RepID=UPI00342E0B2C
MARGFQGVWNISSVGPCSTITMVTSSVGSWTVSSMRRVEAGSRAERARPSADPGADRDYRWSRALSQPVTVSPALRAAS